MKRTLNLRLLLYLLGATVLSATAVHFLHGIQVKRNTGALLGQADRAEEQGRLDQAVSFLSRYLAYESGDIDALVRYGFLLQKQARTPKARLAAVGVFERVLRRQPERHEVRRRLVRAAMDLELFPDAREHLEVLLKTSPGDGELEDLLGQCHEANGKYDKARSCFEDALRYAPARVDCYLRLARLLRHRLDEPRRADERIDAMVAANKDSFRAYLARAWYRKQELGSAADAAKDVARARELAPDEADVLLTAGELAGDKDAFDEARGYLGRGCKRYPKDGRMYRALAYLEVRAKRRDEAVA